MNALEMLFPPTAMSVILLLAGVGLASVWNWHRTHRALLWQAACMALLAGAYMQLMPVWLLWGAAWAAAQAMSVRYGHTIPLTTFLLSTLLALCASWLVSTEEWSASVQWMLGALALGAVLAHVLPVLWRRAVRYRADVWLRGSYTVGTLLVLGMSVGADRTLCVAAGLLLTLMLSLCMLGCVWRDTGPVVDTAVCRDELTALLDRAGLEALWNAARTAHGITVVALCEFKPTVRADAAQVETATPEALCEFAQLLRASVREGDWVARTGQQEFVLGMHAMDMAQVWALEARIQTALLSAPALAGYTASFGMAPVQGADTLDMAVHRADVALHQAKEDGVPRTSVGQTVLVAYGMQAGSFSAWDLPA